MRLVSTFLFSLALILGGLNSVFAQSDPEINDPWEPMNRGIFDFNDTLDVHVFEPIAQGYKDITHENVRIGVGNFFNNLRYPSYLVSDLVQFKFTQALTHTGRFLINTTAGIAGFIDVAKHVGLPDHEEDFGIALAYHGVPAGPYFVIPLIGPSNVRDTCGLVVDFFLDPLYWVRYTNLSTGAKLAIAGSTTALKYVDTRASLLEGIKSAKESSVDYYLFVQGAYYQHRRGVLRDGATEDDDVFDEESELNEGVEK